MAYDQSCGPGRRRTRLLYLSMVTETLRSLLPRIEEFGLASAEELELDTLVARMEIEAVNLQAQLIGPLQFGACTRNP